jgi:glycosyltransferase involved in cell wall biosynthesis
MTAERFLFIASDYRPQPGGRVDYIDNLARGLIRLGNRTRVLAVVTSHRKDRLAFLEHYEEWVIPFPVVHDERPKNWLGNKFISLLEILRCLSPKARHFLETTSFFRGSANSVARLEQVLQREAPTMVVFGHLDMRLYPFALCLLERGLPYGILAHGLDFPRRPNRVNENVRRGSVLRGAKWIAANSHYTRSLLVVWGLPPGRIRIVYPPIAEEAIWHSANLARDHKDGDELKLVTLCRLVKGKGVDIVLRALKILGARGIPFRYVIGGAGTERKSLEALVGELGLRSRVHFMGHVAGDEKWRLLRNGDVFVLTSRPEPTWVEGFGIAFMEAAAFGLPAVGTREGGIPDAVLDGETGILVPPESPEDVAEALTLLYRNPEIRKQMGVAAMERARGQFSPAAVAAHFREEISCVT